LGTESAEVTLTPSIQPIPPVTISVVAYESSYLDLSWTESPDSGIGDSTSIPIENYLLEVDEGFGGGFVKLVEQNSRTFRH
jgi:hypothetical protein